jgi:hypothetical protein
MRRRPGPATPQDAPNRTTARYSRGDASLRGRRSLGRPSGAVTGGEVHADIEGLPEQDIDARYIRLVLFSFLILVGRFATLDGMKVKSVTPMHHLTIVVSSARLAVD